MSKLEFKTIEDIRLGEKLLYAKHDSGVQIYFCPKKDYTETFVMFGTHFGSVDNCFKPQGEEEFVTLPDGIAHFLEHKMFENESGIDVFNLFGEYGANANAFTSFDKTVYQFSCTENFKKNLEILIKFVQEPYFTEQTVLKEQGIIGQEIRMYQDNPGWQLLITLLDAMYYNNPVKIDIAGSSDSIAKITDKLLYKTYDSFYNPNNMVLAICGNVSQEDILSVCDKYLKTVEAKSVERKTVAEPENVKQSVVSKKMSVSIPHFAIGIKDNVVGLEGTAFTDREVAMNILLEMLFGKSSDIYNNLYDAGLINDSFEYEYDISKTYALSMISGESRQPGKVFEIIKQEIAKLAKTGVDIKQFERNKKALYGRDINVFNKTDDVVYEILNSTFNNTGFFDNFNAFNRVEVEDINALLSEFTEQKMALSIIDCVEE